MQDKIIVSGPAGSLQGPFERIIEAVQEQNAAVYRAKLGQLFAPEETGNAIGQALAEMIRPVSIYEKMASDVSHLIEQRQISYNGAYPKVAAILDILYPEGVPPGKIQDIPYMTRILEKMCRTTTDYPDDENPRKDLVGTALLWWHDDEEGDED